MSLIQSTKDFLINTHVTSVGLLATPTTIKAKLFEEALGQAGIKVLVSSEKVRKDIEVNIRRAIAGVIEQRDRDLLIREARVLTSNATVKLTL